MQKNKEKQSLLAFSQTRLLCFVTKQLPSNDVLYARYTAHYNYDINLTLIIDINNSLKNYYCHFMMYEAEKKVCTMMIFIVIKD